MFGLSIQEITEIASLVTVLLLSTPFAIITYKFLKDMEII